jgi:carbamoyltransferase
MRGDGSFALDLSTTDTLFGVPPRHPDGPLLQPHMDLAASIQVATEVVLLDMLQALRREFDLTRLCLAGDVALNCVANGRLLRAGLFREVYIQPAAGDAGGAIGAALAAWHGHFGRPREARRGDRMHGACLGPSFEQTDIERRLAMLGARYEVLDEATLLSTCAVELARGAALGWFQGRMEFGPRALGSRSILGDARSPTMQRTLNLKVKYRESFRPFAPSVLRERVADWFEFDGDSSYMLMVAGVHPSHRRVLTTTQQAASGLDRLQVPRSDIPAVTHVDDSARLQTVHADTQPRYHALLTEFERLTGCPVLVNTSFNVRGEPIVCTPEDAFRCFMGTELDVLAIGNCLLRKARQDRPAAADHRTAFEPD